MAFSIDWVMMISISRCKTLKRDINAKRKTKRNSLLWGHLPAILSDRAPILLAKWAAERGPLMRLRLITAPMVVLTDPEAAARILRRGPDYLPKSRAMYEAFECGVEPRTPNMLTSEDDALWRAVRGAVAPAFSATSLKQALPRMVQLTERACGIVDAAIDAGSVRVNGGGVGRGGGVDSGSGDAGGGSAEVDVTDLTKRVTSDMMGTLLFGEDLQNIDYKCAWRRLRIAGDVLGGEGGRKPPPCCAVFSRKTSPTKPNQLQTKKAVRIHAHAAGVRRGHPPAPRPAAAVSIAVGPARRRRGAPAARARPRHRAEAGADKAVQAGRVDDRGCVLGSVFEREVSRRGEGGGNI
jgi:hypothetical protein